MATFITFEGPEGSGKSTQIHLLAVALQGRGQQVTATREPGGTVIGNAVRAILLDPAHTEMSPRAEALLFSATRAQLVAEVIRPALAAGQIVLCDRYTDSTLAYQGFGHSQPLEPLRRLGEYATGGLTPDLTIFLDIEVEEGLRRKQAGAATEWNRMEEHALAFHKAVRSGYLELAGADPQRWLVVDARQTVDAVHAVIVQRVEAMLLPAQPRR